MNIKIAPSNLVNISIFVRVTCCPRCLIYASIGLYFDCPSVYFFCLLISLCTSSDDPNLLTLHDTRLSRLFAEILLKPTGKFNLTEFLIIWEQSLPQGK